MAAPSSQTTTYMIVAALGEGGAGQVFLAHQIAFGKVVREVVVKRVLPGLGRSGAEALLQEARLVGPLNHPNIVQIYDLVSIDGDFFIAMERVRGVDLRHLLQSVGTPLPLDVSLAIAADVLSALQAVHGASDAERQPLGLVHRDVTPSNILVDFNGHAKLADFGIAKPTLQPPSTRTETGVVKGTLGYLSPEQALGKPVDRRSDLFTFALVLVQMWTGREPFGSGESQFEALRRAVAGERADGLKDAALPPELKDIAQMALATDPNDRYQNAEAFRLALEQAANFLRVQVTRACVRDYLAPRRAALDPPPPVNMPERRAEEPTPPSARIAKRHVFAVALLAAATIFTQRSRPPASAVMPVAELVINSQPDTAEVLIDGVLRSGRTPLILRDLPAGTFSVQVRKEGYLPERKLAHASEQTLDFQLVAEAIKDKPRTSRAPESNTATGFIKFKVSPYGSIVLDGTLLGELPLPDQQVAAGDHAIEISNLDYGFKKKIRVHVTRGRTAVINETIEVR